MVLCQNLMEIRALADHDRGAVPGIIAPNGDGMGLAAVDRDRCKPAMTADRLRGKAHGGALIPVLGAQDIDGLAGLTHGAMEVRPVALDAEIGLVQPPTAPPGPLAAVERRSSWGLYVTTQRVTGA
jgi:hypothetical protein